MNGQRLGSLSAVCAVFGSLAVMHCNSRLRTQWGWSRGESLWEFSAAGSPSGFKDLQSVLFCSGFISIAEIHLGSQ